MQHAALRLRQLIAAEVRAELARQGKTQGDVGEIIGVSQGGASKKVRGIYPIHGEELALLAIALNVPMDRFVPQSLLAVAA